MTVTYGVPQQIDSATWSLPVTTDRATPVTLRVYRDGVHQFDQVTNSGQASITVSVPADSSPFFEVLDQDCRRRPAHPSRFVVHWRASVPGGTYTVEELVGAEWVARATIRDDGGGAYSWNSRALEDTETHQFRVTAIDAAGNSGTVKTMSGLMVRRPDAPVVAVAKSDAALTLEITAA